MLFAAALTSTVVVICTAPCSAFSTTETSSSYDETMFEDTPPVYYCNSSLECPDQYGSRRCENHVCMCDENFYWVYNRTTGDTYCHLCSLLQESCTVNKCCRNPQTTYCSNGVCVCRPGMEEECLSMIYRGRYTPTLGIQLANTLSVSFAFVFLAITFIAVIRKTLFGCTFFRCDSISRVASDSSLNEFIKQKMQNRPPCYDDIEKDRKVPIDIHQPPPEYGAGPFGWPNSSSSRGIVNPSLSISDEVEMNNTAPPNYSTFTTVTDVNVSGAATGRINNEIILTQPIYMNRGSSRYTY